MVLAKYQMKSFLFVDVEYEFSGATLTQNHEWLDFLLPNWRLQQGEKIAIEDVLYLADDIINKIVQ